MGLHLEASQLKKIYVSIRHMVLPYPLKVKIKLAHFSFNDS